MILLTYIYLHGFGNNVCWSFAISISKWEKFSINLALHEVTDDFTNTQLKRLTNYSVVFWYLQKNNSR